MNGLPAKQAGGSDQPCLTYVAAYMSWETDRGVWDWICNYTFGGGKGRQALTVWKHEHQPHKMGNSDGIELEWPVLYHPHHSKKERKPNSTAGETINGELHRRVRVVVPGHHRLGHRGLEAGEEGMGIGRAPRSCPSSCPPSSPSVPG